MNPSPGSIRSDGTVLDTATGACSQHASGTTPIVEETDSVRRQVVARPSGGSRGTAFIRPLVGGLLAATALLVLYLGLITLAQGWSHAIEQFRLDRWYVTAIMLGFGSQVGLFVYLRGLHAQAAASGVAASTGTSTAAMLACCAHHLAEVLPIIGLSGAAIFLNDYKRELLWLGITMNAAGATYLLHRVRKQRQVVRLMASHG